eukprot:GHVR01009747.1.p1 GENE.GHVR01009747.1~~GHVR01009747.1.p1  ORF type:complete len:383 (+),score=82.61 GHVR01009747.1:23-1150(+)
MAEKVIKSISLMGISQVLTFCINILSTRRVNASTFGVSQVNFVMLTTLSLFPLRECFRKISRRGIERVDNKDNTHTNYIHKYNNNTNCYNYDNNITNRDRKDGHITPLTVLYSQVCVTWVGVFLSLSICVFLTFLWLLFPVSTTNTHNYRFAVLLVSIGTCIEALVEPIITIINHYELYHIRSACVSFSCVCRSFLLFYLLYLFPNNHLICYGLCYICDNFIVCVCMSCALFINFQFDWVKILFLYDINKKYKLNNTYNIYKLINILIKIKNNIINIFGIFWGCILPQHRCLLNQFSISTILKFLLSEGEKLVLLSFFPAEVWGVYAVVSNICGMIVRIVLAPLEEFASSQFGRDCDAHTHTHTHIHTHTHRNNH